MIRRRPPMIMVAKVLPSVLCDQSRRALSQMSLPVKVTQLQCLSHIVNLSGSPYLNVTSDIGVFNCKRLAHTIKNTINTPNKMTSLIWFSYYWTNYLFLAYFLLLISKMNLWLMFLVPCIRALFFVICNSLMTIEQAIGWPNSIRWP